ncbi:MAG TPA: M20 family metallopeptidase [Actinomycetota bacterium]
MNRVADLMQQRFTDNSWSTERHPHDRSEGEQLGDVLVGTCSGSAPGPRVLLIGHMDTVFPDGTAASRPFRREGDRAYGPGVADMKDGLLAGFYAVRCLRHAGMDRFQSVTYVCNPDEEIGSVFSGPLIRERAKSADVCFVLESARQNGAIVSARKGVADVRVLITGKAAHAGVEPHRGRSATLQGARATVALHELNERWPGVTVNVGVIQGGTRPNVVADRCELHVDIRAPTAEAYDEALAAVEREATVPHVPEIEVEVRRLSGFPPMEKSEPTARLVERATAIATELGIDLHDTTTGGASDANAVSALGVPTLDGLGPVAGGAHSADEWLDVSSVGPRIALLAALIADPL